MNSCSGFLRSTSLVLPLLSGTGFSMSLLSDTDSCDEDDDEVGEGVVEEELADKPGTTNGYVVRSLVGEQNVALSFL